MWLMGMIENTDILLIHRVEQLSRIWGYDVIRMEHTKKSKEGKMHNATVRDDPTNEELKRMLETLHINEIIRTGRVSSFGHMKKRVRMTGYQSADQRRHGMRS